MKQLKVISSLIIIVAMLMAAVPAKANDILTSQTFTFTYSCTNNNPQYFATLLAQMSVVVTDEGSNQVSFTFYNNVGLASSITDVYFDDGALLGIASIAQSAGVAFSQNATPGELPGAHGCNPVFVTTAGFSADSDPPAEPNGVDAAVEWLKITFNLKTGKTFSDVIGQLLSGVLRIGIHVQGLPNGGSDSFVSGPPKAVTLASFGAKSSRGSVTVNWATGTEIDNAGFNIYRATSADGARTRLNSKLLAAKGDMASGASYSFSDASGYGTYYYWLEDVSYTGKATLHGPVLAVVTSPFRSPLFRPVLPSR